MEILKISEENFEQEVLNSDKPVLIDFYADWCGPCKQMAPIVEEVAKAVSDNVKVVKVNVDEENDLAEQYGISSIPTLVFIKNGEVVRNLVGMRDKDELVEYINNNI